MPAESLVALGQEALLLSVALAAPVLAVAWIVTLVVSVFGSAAHVDSTALAHLPRLAVVALVLVALGPWIGAEIVAFATRAFQLGS